MSDLLSLSFDELGSRETLSTQGLPKPLSVPRAVTLRAGTSVLHETYGAGKVGVLERPQPGTTFVLWNEPHRAQGCAGFTVSNEELRSV